MFGNNKKTTTVSLTDREIKELRSNMSRSERKAFDKRQKRDERDRFWEAAAFAEFFMDD